MKPINVAQDIVPIGQFKTHASRIIRQLHGSQRAVVITQNGSPAAVLISPDEFDRLREHHRFLEAVHDGLADSDAGRLIDGAQLDQDLDDEFGPLQPR